MPQTSRRSWVSLRGLLCLAATAVAIIGIDITADSRSAAAQEAAAPSGPLYPIAVAVAADGTRYVVDRDLPGVWKIVDGQASIFHQGSQRNREPLNAPRSIAIDGQGRVLVGDSAACNVFAISGDGTATPVSSERIGIPMALAIDASGVLFVADLEKHAIVKLTLGDAAVAPEPVARIRAPRGLAFDPQGRLWVISGYQDPVRRIEADGTITTVLAGMPLPYPAAIAITSDGTVLVSDSYQQAIVKVSAEGKVEPWVAGAPLSYPVGIALAADGLIVADSKGKALHRIELTTGTVSSDFPR